MRATISYNSSINFYTQPKLAFNAGPDLVLLVAMLCLWLIVVLALLGEFLSVEIVNMTFCMFELEKRVMSNMPVQFTCLREVGLMNEPSEPQLRR